VINNPVFIDSVHIVAIPDLKPGLTDYVRMCAAEQDDLQSPWSETWSTKLPFLY